MGRNLKFDFIKGCLILLVVLGHSIHNTLGDTSWYNISYHIIYSFHMPLFIFISGFFFKSCLRKDFYNMVSDKFQRLIIPGFLCSIIILFLYFLSLDNIHFSFWPIYKKLISYWYLICLFILTVVFYIFYKTSLIYKLFIIATYIISIVLYKRLPSFILIDCQIIRMFLIFGLGIIYRSYVISVDSESIFKYKHFNYFFTPLCLIEIIMIRLSFGFNLLLYPYYFRILDGITCSYIAFLFLSFIYSHIDFLKPIGIIGKASLSIYLIHMVIIKYFDFFNIRFSVSSDIFNIFIVFSISTIISCLIHYYIKNNFFRLYFLGEKL